MSRQHLLSEPVEDDYTRTESVSFGKPLPLPDPFGFELDTSDLLGAGRRIPCSDGSRPEGAEPRVPGVLA